jgi:hypothetical protein
VGHLISVEIDSELAERLLQHGKVTGVPWQDKDELFDAIHTALAQDDAEDD